MEDRGKAGKPNNEYDKGLILLNRVDSGSYLTEGENIGHEIINHFIADDGNRYIYFPSTGALPDNLPVTSCVFTRKCPKARTVEVIGYCTDLQPVDESVNAANDITYGGIPLSTIFKENVYHGDNLGFSENINRIAGSMYIPKNSKRIFLTLPNAEDSDSTCSETPCPPLSTGDEPLYLPLHSSRRVLNSRRSRLYYSCSGNSSSCDPRAYKELLGLLEADCWEPCSKTRFSTSAERQPRKPTFLEICGKQHSELAFSNFFAYYWTYSPQTRRAFCSFAHEALHIPDLTADFSVVRESNFNVDLWIEDAKHIVVIENKILASINKYDKTTDQLAKYYKYAKSEASKKGKTASFFLLKAVESPITKSECGEHYEIVDYRQLHEHFKCQPSYREAPYFDSFMPCLELHTHTAAERNHQIMQHRFASMIQKARDNKKSDAAS